MNKTARILFIIVGIVFPILIGSLHLFAHFTDLSTPKVIEQLNQTIMVFDNPQIMWNTWGLMSFMMGVAFIIIGLLNKVILSVLPSNSPPPKTAILCMMLYLCCVIYAGNLFEAVPQFYGGILGLSLMIVCFGLIVKKG